MTAQVFRVTLGPCTRSRRCPAAGEVFLDARGADRALRVSWHSEADIVVLSLWPAAPARDLPAAVEDVPDLIDTLRDGLAARSTCTGPGWPGSTATVAG